jgi:hypothetical protein
MGRGPIPVCGTNSKLTLLILTTFRISAGSFKQETEIYTLMPKNERKFWVSHIAIHDRDDVCKKVEELLKVSLKEES